MNGTVRELIEVMTLQFSAFSELHAILQDEQRALLKRDVEGLEQCVRRRNPILSRIEALDIRMASCLSQLGAPASREGIEQCFGHLPPTLRQRAQSEFTALRDAAHRCRKQNEINGKLVYRGRRNTERMLRILSGNTSAGEAIYAQDGRVTAQTASSSIATA